MIRRLKYIFLGAAIVLTGTVVAQQATRFLNVRVLEDLEVDQTATLNALSVQTGPVTLPAASIPDSALSSNVPLKNAANVFTNFQTIRRGSSNSTMLAFENTGAGTNEQHWAWVYNTTGTIDLRTRTDALGPGETALQFQRNGVEVTQITLSADEVELNGALDFNGDADISGTLAVGGTITGNGSGLTSLNASNLSSGTLADARLSSNVPLLNAANTFTKSGAELGSAAIAIAANTPNFLMHETDQGADGGLWAFSLAAGQLRLGAVPDNYSGSIPASSMVLNSTRSGADIASTTIRGGAEIELNADELDFNGDADISGTLSWGGGSAISSSNNVALLNASNTFTNRATFASTSSGSAGSSIVLQSLSPGITLVEEDAGQDEKAWNIARPVNGRMIFFTSTDANIGSADNTFMAVERSGTTVTEIELNANLLDINGNADISGTLSWGGGSAISSSNNIVRLDVQNVFTAPITISANNQWLYFLEADAGENEKLSRIQGANGGLIWATRTDADGTGETWLSVQRNGVEVTEIELNADTLDFNGNADISGTLSWGGGNSISSSSNVALLDASNTFSAREPIIGTHATDTRIRRGDTTGLLRLLGGVDASGSTGGHIALYGSDVEGARANGADLNAGTFGVARVQAPAGTVELNANTLDFNGDVDISGDLVVNGTCTGCGTESSDVRLKENIEEIDDALNKVLRLNGYTFNKIGQERRQAGVIAQEIIEVLPEVVHTNDDGYMSVAYGNITALLIEAIKDQNEIVEQQRDRIDALERIVLELRELNASVTFSADASF